MKLTNILCTAIMLCLLSACSSDSVVDTEADTTNEVTIIAENNLAFAEDVLDAINNHRESLNLEPLLWDEDSENQATNHSIYMATQNQASHDNFYARVEYLQDRGADIVSENVAYGFPDAQSVVEGWLSSPSHREALESNFTHTGIGVITNDLGIPFYTQIFIK